MCKDALRARRRCGLRRRLTFQGSLGQDGLPHVKDVWRVERGRGCAPSFLCRVEARESVRGYVSVAREGQFSDLVPTGVKCPQCRRGELDPARGKFGPIYRCTKQRCGFYLTARPTGRRCRYPRNGTPCGQLMVEGTKTIPNRCSDKSCPNRNPHKLAS